MSVIRYAAVTENQRDLGNIELALWEEFKAAVSIDDFHSVEDVHAQLDAAIAAKHHAAPGVRYAMLRIEVVEVLYVPIVDTAPTEAVAVVVLDDLDKMRWPVGHEKTFSTLEPLPEGWEWK